MLMIALEWNLPEQLSSRQILIKAVVNINTMIQPSCTNQVCVCYTDGKYVKSLFGTLFVYVLRNVLERNQVYNKFEKQMSLLKSLYKLLCPQLIHKNYIFKQKPFYK